MIAEFGTGLAYIGGFVLAIYPVVITLVLDLLILLAILKGGGKDHPFLTGVLFGCALNRRSDSYSDPRSSYLALVILAPIHAGIAVLLALYLGLPLLAWIVGMVPVGALILFGAGLLMQHFGKCG